MQKNTINICKMKHCKNRSIIEIAITNYDTIYLCEEHKWVGKSKDIDFILGTLGLNKEGAKHE